jgi:pyrophosphatase PpaX
MGGEIFLIKAVLFDLDGTLVNTNQLIIESFKHVFKTELNIYPGEEEIVQYFGEPLLQTLARYDEKNTMKLYNTYIQYNEKNHDDIVFAMDGAREVILGLKEKNIKVGVVSSKRRVMVDKGLKVCGLNGLMDVIITPEDTEKHKPDGEPLIKACSILGIDPTNALMVGDSQFDILCGKNAISKTCLVKYTAVPIENILKYKPDFLIEKLTDLLNIVDNENEKYVDICNHIV